MRHTIAAFFLLAGLISATGCGQTGRLYLPQEEPEREARKAPDGNRDESGQTDKEDPA